MFKATQADAALFQWQDRQGSSILLKNNDPLWRNSLHCLFVGCECGRVDSLTVLQSWASVKFRRQGGIPSLNRQSLKVTFSSFSNGGYFNCSIIQSVCVTASHMVRDTQKALEAIWKQTKLTLPAVIFWCVITVLSQTFTPLNPILVLSENHLIAVKSTTGHPLTLFSCRIKLTTVQSLFFPKGSFKAMQLLMEVWAKGSRLSLWSLLRLQSMVTWRGGESPYYAPHVL